jgi:hypothetical protein
VREHELIGPARVLDAIHAAQRSLELLRQPVLVSAEEEQRRAAHEDEAPARTKEAVGLRYPAVRVGEQRGSVLRVCEVKRRVGQRHVLCERLNERKVQAELGLHASCSIELSRVRVDPDDLCSGSCEARGSGGRAAAELDRVEPGDVAQNPKLGAIRAASRCRRGRR